MAINNKDLQDSGGVRLPHLYSPPSISEVSNDSSRAIFKNEMSVGDLGRSSYGDRVEQATTKHSVTPFGLKMGGQVAERGVGTRLPVEQKHGHQPTLLFSWREDMENEFLGTWAEHHADDMTSDLNERREELGVFDKCLTCERDCKMVKCRGVEMRCFGYRGPR